MKDVCVNPENLLAAGYEECSHGEDGQPIKSKIRYGCIVSSDSTDLYPISVTLSEDAPGTGEYTAFATAHFDADGGETCFSVELTVVHGDTIQKMEDFLQRVYASMGCVPSYDPCY